jgi:hypothetical protein
MPMPYLLALLFVLHLSVAVKAQQLMRIKSDFSVKTKIKGEPEARLVMGTCYYELGSGQMVYEVRFPEREIWVFRDSVQWIVRNDSLIRIQPSQLRAELSVLHLSLMQQLSHYGLKNSAFTVEDVKTDGKQIITTWKPPGAAAKKIGKVATSNQDKKLVGVIFYHPKGHILRKQFFKNYLQVQGIPFPTEVIDIVYEDKREVWQQTTYTKVVINEAQPGKLYTYAPLYVPASAGTNR